MRKKFEFHKLKIDPSPVGLPGFMREFSGEPDEGPDFTRYAGLGLENIGPDDVVWLTPDAEGQVDVRPPKEGYEQYSPFDLVLLAIIRAHPKEGKRNSLDANERERLRNAKRALFGKSELHRGPSRTDDEILLKVARRVLEAIVGDKGDAIELAPLVREFALQHYKHEELARDVNSGNAIVRRLIAHFEKHRDDYLTRVTTRDDYARAKPLRVIDESLDRLESLGVKVDRKVVPRMGEI